MNFTLNRFAVATITCKKWNTLFNMAYEDLSSYLFLEILKFLLTGLSMVPYMPFGSCPAFTYLCILLFVFLNDQLLFNDPCCWQRIGSYYWHRNIVIYNGVTTSQSMALFPNINIPTIFVELYFSFFAWLSRSLILLYTCFMNICYGIFRIM